MDEAVPSSLTVSLDEKTGELSASFDPAGDAPLLDLAALKRTVADRGWDRFYFDDKAASSFLADCQNAKEPLNAVIGARRDGEFSLSIDPDLMTAWLTLVPPQGGKPVSLEELGAALRDQGIVHGVRRDRIDAAIAAGQCERVPIAEGLAPQEGQPTRFETLFDRQEEAPDEDSLERIQYRDLCHVLLVKPGDRLMRRIPPVPGKSGINIKGQEIPAKQMLDLPFAVALQGAEPDREHPDLLVATLGGQPQATKNGVSVNPLLDVVDVDLSTGSLNFEGTLRVAGDVKTGMRIKVSGDVIVNGTVEAAEIVAGGNVAVRGGILGHPDPRPGATTLPETTARIICEGSVQALFMENARVEAGKSILIERSARQCELVAREEIIAGKAGSRNGQIVGGRTQATIRVATATLGSATGMKTLVQVGVDPYLDEQIAKAEREEQRKFDEIDRVIKLQAYFRQNPAKGAGGVAEKVEATRVQLLADLDSLTAELKELRAKVELAEDGHVAVSSAIYYGAEVRIGSLTWHAPDDMGGAVLRLDAGRIHLDGSGGGRARELR